MKIAFIVSGFPTLWETFILNQITGLIDMGYHIEIFAEYKPALKKVHRDVYKYNLMNKVSYFNIPKNKIMRIMKWLLLLIFNFHKNPRKVMDTLNFVRYGKDAVSLKPLYLQLPFLNKRFDILLCHFGYNGGIGVMLKKIGVEGKVVTAFHGLDISSFINKEGANSYKSLIEEGDLFLPVSNFWREKLLSMGFPKNKLVVHHMGIDMAHYNYMERNIQTDEKVHILSVGRMVEKKGYEYSLRAVANILKKKKNVSYTIVGDGPLRHELRDLVKELDISGNVEFVKMATKNQMKEIYKNAHILLLPSVTAGNFDQEGIPVVLMEAQAMGLPVVSTIHTGIPEVVIDGKSGYLVPERNVDEITNKLEFLIDNPELWAKIGKVGRQHIEVNFNIKTLNKKLIEVLEHSCLNLKSDDILFRTQKISEIKRRVSLNY